MTVLNVNLRLVNKWLIAGCSFEAFLSLSLEWSEAKLSKAEHFLIETALNL